MAYMAWRAGGSSISALPFRLLALPASPRSRDINNTLSQLAFHIRGSSDYCLLPPRLLRCVALASPQEEKLVE